MLACKPKISKKHNTAYSASRRESLLLIMVAVASVAAVAAVAAVALLLLLLLFFFKSCASRHVRARHTIWFEKSSEAS